MPGIWDVVKQKGFKGFTDPVQMQANAYKKAYEQAIYADTGEQYGQGLKQITNYLAGAGPLADSGAGTALRARLASDIYRGARGQVARGYADYLRQLQMARNAYNYQRELMKYGKKLNKKGPLDYLGGIAGGAIGGLTGGPLGAVAGYSAGSSLGGGGVYASDAYYG